MTCKTTSPAFRSDRLYLRSFLALLWCYFALIPVTARGSDRKGAEPQSLLQVSAEGAVKSYASPWVVDRVLGDFDGDHQPDLARAEILDLKSPDNRYRVNVTLSRGSVSSFEFHLAHSAGVNIEARDIDGDHDLDLVITSGVFHKPVGLWVNDGAGTFTPVDSSLYPDSVWRGPPALKSNQAPADDLNAILEGFPFSFASVSASVSEPLLKTSRIFWKFSPPSHWLLLLSGPLSVRPPPSC